LKELSLRTCFADEFIASSRVPQSMSELHQKEYQSMCVRSVCVKY